MLKIIRIIGKKWVVDLLGDKIRQLILLGLCKNFGWSGYYL